MFLTSGRGQLSCQAILPEEKCRAEASPSPGRDATSWLYTEFVSFWFSSLTVNDCGRRYWALQPRCVTCASVPFYSLRLEVESGES